MNTKCECCCNKCESNSNEIKVYGTFVNATLNLDIDEPNCQANDTEPDSGHNDAIAYAYLLHDGRFRADDEDLFFEDRFQDQINKRITNITYEDGITTIEGDTRIENLYVNKDGQWVKIEEAGSYDDAWLKDIIGATPDNVANKKQSLGGDDIIAYILKLKAKIDQLETTIKNMDDNCLWKKSGDDAIVPKDINGTNPKVYGAGFYDISVT